mmetsp:Transcript_66765/g.149918  ORF Transcript_66765/g.149918 Transcript_66765/m.149918 type:complete len:257 (-) Transcript_66765:1142-1912(-)
MQAQGRSCTRGCRRGARREASVASTANRRGRIGRGRLGPSEASSGGACGRAPCRAVGPRSRPRRHRPAGHGSSLTCLRRLHRRGCPGHPALVGLRARAGSGHVIGACNVPGSHSKPHRRRGPAHWLARRCSRTWHRLCRVAVQELLRIKSPRRTIPSGIPLTLGLGAAGSVSRCGNVRPRGRATHVERLRREVNVGSAFSGRLVQPRLRRKAHIRRGRMRCGDGVGHPLRSSLVRDQPAPRALLRKPCRKLPLRRR